MVGVDDAQDAGLWRGVWEDGRVVATGESRARIHSTRGVCVCVYVRVAVPAFLPATTL